VREVSQIIEAVVARRTYTAAREIVFRAFTDPTWIARWLSPSNEVSTTVLAFDLRPEGAYRLAFHFSDGRTDIVVGRYLEIAKDERLVYTWMWEEPDPFAGVESLVTVDLSDCANGTAVVVTHERLPNEERRRIHDTGWQETLARLARLLEAVNGSPHPENLASK
jgi:uncharacterized protein YndB with AHSA1/START domain